MAVEQNRQCVGLAGLQLRHQLFVVQLFHLDGGSDSVPWRMGSTRHFARRGSGSKAHTQLRL